MKPNWLMVESVSPIQTNTCMLVTLTFQSNLSIKNQLNSVRIKLLIWHSLELHARVSWIVVEQSSTSYEN